jgi:hypothetical protein
MTGSGSAGSAVIWWECAGCEMGCMSRRPAAEAAPTECEGRGDARPAQWVRMPGSV